MHMYWADHDLCDSFEMHEVGLEPGMLRLQDQYLPNTPLYPVLQQWERGQDIW